MHAYSRLILNHSIDILPPTPAIVDYAIGLEKLSAHDHFFDDAQTAVSL